MSMFIRVIDDDYEPEENRRRTKRIETRCCDVSIYYALAGLGAFICFIVAKIKTIQIPRENCILIEYISGSFYHIHCDNTTQIYIASLPDMNNLTIGQSLNLMHGILDLIIPWCPFPLPTLADTNIPWTSNNIQQCCGIFCTISFVIGCVLMILFLFAIFFIVKCNFKKCYRSSLCI